ncbi:MAG TPA: acetolactate synthase 3 large subunit, partial [Novosphingobium sp.]|nr:acetolactate synthase 3 large subunit [Novosphingobium sp.]
GDVGHVLEDLLRIWKSRGRKTNREGLAQWWKQIDAWKAVNCLAYKGSETIIKPQLALQRLEA